MRLDVASTEKREQAVVFYTSDERKIRASSVSFILNFGWQRVLKHSDWSKLIILANRTPREGGRQKERGDNCQRVEYILYYCNVCF